tara:strand:+ start:311 stop:472 length:162 start_codon:yes stop_codon:yes gene_type:complete
MNIIKTIPHNLHEKIDVIGLTEEQKKIKKYRKNRENFMKRVYETLGKNFIKKS